MSRADEIFETEQEISPAEFRDERSSRGKSSKYRQFREVAKQLDSIDDGGSVKKYEELTETEVSSIRNQILQLVDEDKDRAEREFRATRKKMKDGGKDKTNEDGEQLYYLYIYRQ
ncbi:hypothetical protein [Salinibacter ruber]|uniref:hypothetical protein n=1 Tax=Salinibacter ruber TaxID=146919 RepID=UPI002166D26C|nr:hypothetical protein [Salinibacter ruber]MCS3698093.1 hypothetical protein [Salinibacter ruber]